MDELEILKSKLQDLKLDVHPEGFAQWEATAQQEPVISESAQQDSSAACLLLQLLKKRGQLLVPKLDGSVTTKVQPGSAFSEVATVAFVNWESLHVVETLEVYV